MAGNELHQIKWQDLSALSLHEWCQRVEGGGENQFVPNLPPRQAAHQGTVRMIEKRTGQPQGKKVAANGHKSQVIVHT
jgi:hypothetical protein